MGKGKAKKAAPTVIGDEFFKSSEASQCTCNHEHPRAADGHNVDGWTDEDIRIYNELLTERAKLEKEKNELEQKSARHQAERALLNEDAAVFDSLFKAELGGEYKFTGKTACCLDVSNNSEPPSQLAALNNICHHEVCSRAKTQGVSWMEMDTIKYYHARITSEKSQRMKNALRKQRDVELARVKKEDEEEIALRNRKSALHEKSLALEAPFLSPEDESGDMSLLDAFGSKDSLLSPKDNAILEAARENEQVVKRIRSRLDKIRYDVHAGRVTAFDARMKLDQANKEMAEAERKNNTFKEMIFTAGAGQDIPLAASSPASANLSRALSKSLAASSSDAFTQALNVMKGFFSASDPRDVQAAITDLRSVLEVNGPMSPVLQKSFQALEDMLAKPNAKGFSVDLTSSDGTKRTCTNVVEVLLMLRSTRDPATLDATAEELKLDKGTLKANRECIRIEEEAVLQMQNQFRPGMTLDFQKCYETLKDIKEKAALKSPIPPLSDIVLEQRMDQFLYSQATMTLVNQQATAATDKELAGKITSMVIIFSEKNVDRFMESLAKLEREAKRMGSEANLPIHLIMPALKTVKASMGASVAKQLEKKEQSQTKDSLSEVTESAQSSEDLIPDPLQLKKIAEIGSRLPYLAYPTNRKAILDAMNNPTDANNLRAALAEMDECLKGLSVDDVLNLLCSTEDGPDASQKRLLKQDLQIFLTSSHGKEDPRVIERIQRRISHFATVDMRKRQAEQRRAQAEKKKESKTKAKGHKSKFQEELTTGDEPSPPPYSANEGRARKVKVKHVPVGTPQIQDSPPEDSKTSISQVAEALQKSTMFEQKAAAMSQDLQKMRRDLQTLTRLPGIEGALATKLRKQLDSLTNGIEELELEGNLEYGSIENASSGKGKERETLEVGTRDVTSTGMAKKNKKKRTEKSPADLSAASPVPEATSLPTETLSEREETIRTQLRAMQTNLRTLAGTPVPSSATDYGIPVAFDGITSRLQAQLNGHAETALLLCDANGWNGLKTWVEQEFRAN